MVAPTLWGPQAGQGNDKQIHEHDDTASGRQERQAREDQADAAALEGHDIDLSPEAGAGGGRGRAGAYPGGGPK
eukprot:2577563-Pyramimonas_sp.AAC.1